MAKRAHFRQKLWFWELSGSPLESPCKKNTNQKYIKKIFKGLTDAHLQKVYELNDTKDLFKPSWRGSPISNNIKRLQSPGSVSGGELCISHILGAEDPSISKGCHRRHYWVRYCKVASRSTSWLVACPSTVFIIGNNPMIKCTKNID